MDVTRNLPALPDIAPDFVALLTDRERPTVDAYYSKIQQAPGRYEAMMTPGEHQDLHFVRLAYTLAWYSMARRLFLWVVVVLIPFAIPSAILGGTWRLLLLPGLAMAMFVALVPYQRMASQMRVVRAFFTERLGSWDPGNKRMM